MEAVEFYKVVRAQVEHVVNSRNQRVIWLVIAQSFFFSGFAIMVTGNPPTDGLKAMQKILLNVFPIAALLTVFFTYIDIFYASLHLKELERIYESKKQEIEHLPQILGGKHHFFESASSHLIPILFILSWIYILTRF